MTTLHLEKLQIGSPGKDKDKDMFNFGTPNATPRSSVSPVHMVSPPCQPPIWKDYPYVSNVSQCGSGAMSQSQQSFASTNGLPIISMFSYGPSSPNHPNFNNYRSSAVADIFGGRSKTPLISPSRLTTGPIFPNFGTTAKMSSIGIYYHQRSAMSPEVYNVNLMEDPISRSSSQSSGFISQKELEDQEFGNAPSPSSSPYANGNGNFSYYPESIYSQGPFSMISGGGQSQQIWIGPSQHHQEFNRSYMPPSRNSTPVGNWSRGHDRSGTITTPPGVACSRFGPRTSSFSQKSPPSDGDPLFMDTDDESGCESFKTAPGGSSVYSLRYRKRRNRRKERTCGENNRKSGDIKDGEPESKFVRIFSQLIRSVSLFLIIVLMFGVIFGSGIARIEFLEAPTFQYFEWFADVSHNLSHCVRDTVFFV